MRKSAGRKEQRLLARRNRVHEGRKLAKRNEQDQKRAARGLLK